MSPAPALSTPPKTATILVEPLSRTATEPLLDRIMSFNCAPSWMTPVLERLRDFERNGANEPGIGDFRIATGTADRVRQLLASDAIAWLPEPGLSVFSGGGVSVMWNVGGRELQFSAYPDLNGFVYLNSAHDDLDSDDPDDGVVNAGQSAKLREVVQTFLDFKPRR